MNLDAFPQYPACMFCADHGLTFDELNGFRLCTCPAGVKSAELGGQDIVDQANESRRKLGAVSA